MKTKSFLVTGSSTGIGRESAIHLARGGFQVFAGIRKKEDADSLKNLGLDGLVPVTLDVTSDKSIEEAQKFIERHLGGRGLDGVVNNAGIVIAGPQEFLQVAAFKKQLETNVVGVVAVTQAFLPLIRKSKGRIVNMGSLSGLIALPFLGPYSASKFALRALTDSLRLELKPWNILVSLIEPGPIATPIWEKSLITAHSLRKDCSPDLEKYYGSILAKFEKSLGGASRTAVSVDVVVKVVDHALLSGRPRKYYPVGRGAKIQAAMAHLVPQGILDKVISKGAGLS